MVNTTSPTTRSPFADTNNPTHHSTAFFPSTTIETVVVDPGSGNASQLGQASFGGNINMYSRAAKDERSATVEGIVGNWNTFIGRVELQSGEMKNLGGAKLIVTGQYLQSDGALTYSPVNSKNLYAKLVRPLGPSNTLTLMSTWNRNFYYQSDVLKGANGGAFTALSPAPAGSTLHAENCAPTSNIGQFGLNYGMSNDPTRADYYRYNRTDKTTDFSYIRLQSEFGSGFSMDNRVYMYGYTNNTLSGNGKLYGVGEFAIGQDIGKLRLGLQVSNVFNSRAIIMIASGKTYGVDDQFSFLPPRSFTVDARVKF